MVSSAFTDKKASNDEMRKFFPVMIRHANDEPRYVMKAMNCALRQVGKRNEDVHKEAMEEAHQILLLGTKLSRWIAQWMLYANYKVKKSA